MKRTGIINGLVLSAIASLGHGDHIAIADCGLSIPLEVPKIDLALIKGIPSFQDVTKALAMEIIVQKVIVAQEMRIHNPNQYAFITHLIPGIPIEEIPHSKFKQLLGSVKAVIRTGEATPYSNVILEAGVDF